jgi:hypothetical protein
MQAKINKLEIIDIDDEVFNEFLNELVKNRQQFILDDGEYVKTLRINYTQLRNLNIDTRKLKIIEHRIKPVPPITDICHYVTNKSIIKAIEKKQISCITCRNAIISNCAVNSLSKMTWTQDVCLKCKDYSNFIKNY